jgi:hypothetical protein
MQRLRRRGLIGHAVGLLEDGFPLLRPEPACLDVLRPVAGDEVIVDLT